MAVPFALSSGSEPALPPGYRLVRLREGGDAFGEAVRRAPRSGAGTFVSVGSFNALDFAVVLEPEESLSGARRAVFAGMVALAEALSAAAPPEKPLSFAFPSTILCDGARIGGSRLAWPADCQEDEVPAWLVFGAMVLRAKADGHDPGRHADATWLVEEGFEPDDIDGVIPGFARHLLLAFDRWGGAGVGPLADAYLARLPERNSEGRRRIDLNGDLLVPGSGRVERLGLLDPLAAAEWYDPATRLPRI